MRHEDLSRNPVHGFRGLYEQLGLEFTEQTQQVIKNYSSSKNPSETDAPVGSDEILLRNSQSNIWNWKSRLTASEIVRIHAAVKDVSSAFYSTEDW